MIDAGQILSTRAFCWLLIKTGLESSKVQNIRSVVMMKCGFFFFGNESLPVVDLNLRHFSP